MAKKRAKNQYNEGAPANHADEASSELSETRWSIVTFETIAARGLSYDEALRAIKDLEQQKKNGLCIVTDEAAARASNGKKRN